MCRHPPVRCNILRIGRPRFYGKDIPGFLTVRHGRAAMPFCRKSSSSVVRAYFLQKPCRAGVRPFIEPLKRERPTRRNNASKKCRIRKVAMTGNSNSLRSGIRIMLLCDAVYMCMYGRIYSYTFICPYVVMMVRTYVQTYQRTDKCMLGCN